MKNKLKQISLDLEAIIKIQEKIIRANEQTIKKEKIVSDLLFDRYLDVMIDNGNWKFRYGNLYNKWFKAGIYARDRTAYMRNYMRKKRANGSIKHWRKYIEEKGIPISHTKLKTMKGKYATEKKNKRGTKSK